MDKLQKPSIPEHKVWCSFKTKTPVGESCSCGVSIAAEYGIKLLFYYEQEKKALEDEIKESSFRLQTSDDLYKKLALINGGRYEENKALMELLEKMTATIRWTKNYAMNSCHSQLEKECDERLADYEGIKDGS